MTQQDASTIQLDSAKNRLRTALTQLENIVDEKVANAALASPNDSELTRELSHIRDALREKNLELEQLKQESTDNNPTEQHLRNENQQLQGEIGEVLEDNKAIKQLNKRVTVRVDSLIAELNAVLQ